MSHRVGCQFFKFSSDGRVVNEKDTDKMRLVKF